MVEIFYAMGRYRFVTANERRVDFMMAGGASSRLAAASTWSHCCLLQPIYIQDEGRVSATQEDVNFLE